MKLFREEILQGVDVVFNSKLPGRIIVYEQDAEPVLTGHNVEDVIIAAAKLGNGRIVVFSHDIFGIEFGNQEKSCKNSVFYENVKKWLLNKSKSQCNVLKLDEAEVFNKVDELKQFDIILSLSCAETTSSDLIIEYIKDGGSFVHAATAWGWCMLNPNKDLSEMPYVKVLKEAGIMYSKDCRWENEEVDFEVADNKADGSHLGKCLTKESDFQKIVENVRLIDQMKDIPCLCNDLKCYLEKHWKPAYDEANKLVKSGKIKTKTAFQRRLLDFCYLGFQHLDKENFKACGIEFFPGDFSDTPILSNKTISFRSNLEDFFFTSCYVPAGYEVILKVKEVRNKWAVSVGAHTDELQDDEVNRWPKIVCKTEITSPGDYNLRSPFGGSIYFLSPNKSNSEIEATINNIVSCPRFDLVEQSRPWEESRNEPGLWADISGKYLTITLPSCSVRNMDDPSPVLSNYDKLLEAYHDLRGTDINSERRMWIVSDVQPSAGYMHSGYPIVTHLDVADPKDIGFLLSKSGFDKESFKEKWGIFHEIGHNMQRDEWTFEGTSEVTVNIFTLYGMEVIFGVSPWIHPWLSDYFDKAVKYLNDGAEFDKWKQDPGLALFIYAQLAAGFGWDVYKKVFRRYNRMRGEDMPQTDQDKIDTWFLIFSEESKSNLTSLALLWGIPISEKGLSKLRMLKCEYFIPDDEITQKASGRVDFVKGNKTIKQSI